MPKPFESIYLFFLLMGAFAQAYHFVNHSSCFPEIGNYTQGSVYETNLVSILSSGSSRIDDTGFYTVSLGSHPDLVTVGMMCRADMQLDDCRSCIASASSFIFTSCPFNMQAVYHYLNCTLSYSNGSLLGVNNVDYFSIFLDTVQFKRRNVTEVLNNDFDLLVNNLKYQAASGGSMLKVATGSSSRANFQAIYSILQCMPYINSSDCVQCLSDAFQAIRVTYDGLGAVAVLSPTCRLEYATYPFYNLTRIDQVQTLLLATPLATRLSLLSLDAPPPDTPEAPSPETSDTPEAPSPETSDTPEAPSPETPDSPEAPSPETADTPEAPSPETADTPEAPSPETPDSPEAPSPETPDTPEAPSPETPDTPEAPSPETPDTPEAPSPETPDTPEAPSPETQDTPEAPSSETPDTPEAPSPESPDTREAPSPETSDAPRPETPDTSASVTPVSSATPAVSTSTPTSPPPRPRGGSPAIIISPIVVVASLVILAGAFVYGRKRFNSKKPASGNEGDGDEIIAEESLQFDFNIIRGATDDFSIVNKLGEGGFGVVYKGILENGQLVAVKRLSNGSTQGDTQFKNEVKLLGKLHHKNLVKFHGFAIEGKERVLIYEFVQRGSLDHYIYDSTGRRGINWYTRYKIIEGVAKGLVYLHEDSGFRIIHRDLKPGNILLDGEMIPKIADFGLAKLFENDESYNSTNRVVGTPGYMAPEYQFQGHISVKTDVFSFGVLVLEIISGQRNNSFMVQGIPEDMMSFAWRSWQQQTVENMIDPMLRSDPGCFQGILRCIQIGLLCIQTNAMARPAMATILQMLKNSSIAMPPPSLPPFFNFEGSDVSTVGQVTTVTDSSRNGASNMFFTMDSSSSSAVGNVNVR